MKPASTQSLRIPYALAVHSFEEKKRILSVLDEHRTNMGKETAEFEGKVAISFGKKYGIMVNSGSSANLLAFELLNLPEESEIITPVLTFSTTISPLIKKKLIPVFVDVREGTYVVNENQIEPAISKKTKALLIPLLLGNVPNLKKLKAIAKKYNLLLVEDSCDTLGATFDNKPSGVYSDISTTSFFGSHIITAGGNGGMILVNNEKWRDRLRMLRGWGRTSSIFGESEDIKKRFNYKIDDLSYDAKFIFDEVGYNFLPNEMCAAFGNAQFEKLNTFRKVRNHNFQYLYTFFKQFEKYFILPIQDKKTQTQWLAFPLTITKIAPFTRLELITYLEQNNIQTRPIFTGNILKQPGFKHIPCRILPQGYPITDAVMERGFVIGCHQGMGSKHLRKIESVMRSFLKSQ